jgi:hypothetical protein
MNSLILTAQPVKDGPPVYLIYLDKKHSANTTDVNRATVFHSEDTAGRVAAKQPIPYTIIPKP